MSGSSHPIATHVGAASVVAYLDGRHLPPSVAFTRADLVFIGVDHSRGSYEVRTFLENPAAHPGTPRTQQEGYAGRFHVFGHGGCFGDVGHCDVPPRSTDATDLRPIHPLTPMDTYVSITDALRHALGGGSSWVTVTMVPISLPPRRADRAASVHRFRFERIELHLYLTPEAPTGT